ncbi:WD40 repeat domain-containing protein [Phormidium sp. LEGE 05292]|uniref:nSTAND1 domain-containing NTPase n=1 Tax=[Phormidium] sp. LEGE 05292 TaxID=767427 RepID=UPI0018820EDD|nr:WD40 repeat domain-containing protein [Phormidium sp. LEGE 05292]MBE9225183.1 WD40 repeat domain-containing protein [Phormidium sp. LEGE 05292]
MGDEDRSAKLKGSANSSAIITGDSNTATITITNYYYRENIPVVPVESTVADDENLPCPYRGLFHFGPDDAKYFFGREVFVEELFAATQTRNFILLLGASGSGKSSVVLAGLVPKLQQEHHWLFTHFRPGSEPFHALAEALVPLYEPDKNATEQMAQARQLAEFFVNGSVLLQDVFSKIQQKYPNHRVLLIADQFEELYTLCAEQKTRHSFLDILLASFPTFPSQSQFSRVLVATMRADFLGNALSYPKFGEVLRNADIKIRSMNREELSQVIVKPAKKLGVTFQDGLVKRILDDVEDQPGNLPLLEFALTELWNKRTGKQLTHEIYEEIGQVEGALARHADEKYCNLTDEEKEKVRRIFIQLVRPGEGVEDTRRIAMKAELGEQSWSLVKQLADARLVVTSRNATSQETVEVVHEALIRNWGELREWMNTDRVFRAWQERLRAAKGQWEATNRDSGSLLRGAALAEAEEQLKQRPEDLIDEQEFIEQSIEEGNRLKQVEAARRKREIRTAWGIAAGSVVAVVISTGLGLMAWNQKNQSELNQAESLGRYSQSLFNEGKDLDAFVAAINARKILQSQHTTNPEVMNALLEGVAQGRERNSLVGHSNSVNSVSFSPDGKTLASGSFDGTIKLWNLATGREIRTLKGHNSYVYSVSFSPDGNTLASGSDDKTIKLWNLATGREIRTLKRHSNPVISVSFSPDGKTLASGSADKTIKLWNLGTGREIRTLKGHNSYVWRVSFSPDGKTLASGSVDKTIKLWNLGTGREIRTLMGHSNSVYSVSFSPDGKTLASGSVDKTIKLWNLGTGREIRTLMGHSNSVYSVSFSPDGKTLASGSVDKTIKLWNLGTGREIRTLMGHSNPVYSVSFSPDGKTLASGSDDKTIKLWNLGTGREIRTLMGHSNSVISVSFSPDGKTLASGSFDGTIKLWNLGTGREICTLMGHSNPVYSVSFSPDGKTLASGSDDKTIKLWNLGTGREIRTLMGHSNSVISVSFSPDGKTLASGSFDGTIKLWNLGTGREICTLMGHSNPVYSVSFSPDGKTLASGSDDKTIKLWNLGTGREIRTLMGHSNSVISVSFSPDGKTLASGSFDGTIKLWNLGTGREICTLMGHSNPVYSVSFSPDGKTLASGSDDKTIKLWNLGTGREIRTLKGHSNSVISVSFSPDGKTLASGSDDKTIKLWNLGTGREIRTLKGHSNSVISVSFSPDGKTLASGSDDGTIKLWNLGTGREIRTLKGHSNSVISVSFNPDGKTLASGSDDKTIKLWNLGTGREIRTLKGHSNSVNSVSFSPDGKTLASGSDDKTIKLWNLPELELDPLLRRNCDLVRSYLESNPQVSESDRHLCDGVPKFEPTPTK